MHHQKLINPYFLQLKFKSDTSCWLTELNVKCQMSKITSMGLKFQLNPKLRSYWKIVRCRSSLFINLTFSRSASSLSWWWWIHTKKWIFSIQIIISQLTNKKITYIHWTQKIIWKFLRNLAQIPIKLSCPDLKRSTHGNRRVPLSGSQFPRLHLRTRKAYDILVRLENSSLPIL